MRKLLAILQIFVLMAAMALPTAFAAEAPIMLAGLEAASSSSSTEAQHDWDTNLFFQTMQEKTGIAFSFTEYVSREAWTEAKTEMLAGEVAMPDMFFKAELTPQETLAFYEAGKLIDLRPYLVNDADPAAPLTLNDEQTTLEFAGLDFAIYNLQLEGQT